MVINLDTGDKEGISKNVSFLDGYKGFVIDLKKGDSELTDRAKKSGVLHMGRKEFGEASLICALSLFSNGEIDRTEAKEALLRSRD